MVNEHLNIPYYQKLTDIAEGVVGDIQGDREADGIEGEDFGFDLWIEDLNGVTYGVIDMGDMYQGCYTWDGETWQQYATAEPQETIDRILKKRGFGNF